jgi:hypothetical protein
MATPASGSGTVGDPYLITSAAEFAMIDDDAANLAAHYKQTQDITGVTAGIDSTFSGTYDGQGYGIDVVISNGDQGLFFRITGTIERMYLTGSIAEDEIGSFCYDLAVGGIIHNCRSDIALTATTSMGAFVGIKSGTVSTSLYAGIMDGTGTKDAYFNTDCCWDKTLAQGLPDEATYGLTTLQLRGDATLPTGFDPTIWTKRETPLEAYPYSYPELIQGDLNNGNTFMKSDDESANEAWQW